MGVTSQLAAFRADIKLSTLPPEMVTRACFLVLDLIGNVVRTRHDAESTASFVSTMRAMGMATGNAGVFGDAARYSPGGRRSSTGRWRTHWTSTTRMRRARCIRAPQ